MRGAGRGASIGTVNAREPLRVSLEFAPGAEPASGTVRAPGRPDRAFAGWTELFAALEATLHGLRAEGDDAAG
jgi:hypothetical protein